jgi:outer membrane protein assembly factor BamB
MLCALDAATGMRRWETSVYDACGKPDLDVAATNRSYRLNGPPADASLTPLLWRDRIIVAPQGSEATAAAFDAASGDVIWKSPFIGRSGAAPAAIARLAGAEQVLVTSHKIGAGIDPVTGQVLWSGRLNGPQIAFAPPVVLPGDRVMFSYAGLAPEVFQVTLREGRCQALHEGAWRLHAGAGFRPALDHGRVHLVTKHSYHGKAGIYAVDAETYTPVWYAPKVPGVGWGPFVAADGLLLVAGDEGQLHLIDAAAGPGDPEADAKSYVSSGLWKEYDGKGRYTLRATMQLPWEKPVRAPMTLHEGRLLIAGEGAMVCLDLRAEEATIKETRHRKPPMSPRN